MITGVPKQLSPKDTLLVYAALRKAFARSDLHEEVSKEYYVEHSSPANPRCSNWSWCAACGVVTPRWKTVLDHKEPVCPLTKHKDQMTVDEIIDRMWCDRENLWVLCKEPCHYAKSKQENAIRPKRSRKKKGT